jgi:signal peptidase II
MHILWITAAIIAVDQVTKQIVLRHMYVGESIPLVGNWLKLTFTENPGMAFGITFGPRGMVTFLSLAATILIFLYLFRVRRLYRPYRMSIACILGGAIGNIIDRVFYGVLSGDAPLFAGRVVDFIHVNLWRGYVPEAWPIVGGKYTALFPIWNVADMAIVLGVVGILLFQGAFQNDLIREQTQRIPTGDGVPSPGAPEANPAATAPTEGSSGE